MLQDQAQVMPYRIQRLSSVHFGETSARTTQKLEDGAPYLTLMRKVETARSVQDQIPVIKVHFITNAARPSTCDAIPDTKTLLGAFWRDFSKNNAKARRRSALSNSHEKTGNCKISARSDSCDQGSFHHKCCKTKHM